MNQIPRIGELTATKMTVVYVLVGGAWITMMDSLVMETIYEGQTRLWPQMSKGLCTSTGRPHSDIGWQAPERANSNE